MKKPVENNILAGEFHVTDMNVNKFTQLKDITGATLRNYCRDSKLGLKKLQRYDKKNLFGSKRKINEFTFTQKRLRNDEKLIWKYSKNAYRILEKLIWK